MAVSPQQQLQAELCPLWSQLQLEARSLAHPLHGCSLLFHLSPPHDRVEGKRFGGRGSTETGSQGEGEGEGGKGGCEREGGGERERERERRGGERERGRREGVVYDDVEVNVRRSRVCCRSRVGVFYCSKVCVSSCAVVG
eukprot:scaffold23346_cov31-Tisochrysis_lutea.AAC.1